MSDQNPKPEKIPTYEDIEKELGPDLMSFMSEMLSEPKDRDEE